MAAMKPEAFEYLLNTSKFRARYSLKKTDLGVGTSGNEAAHAELKSWGRNVFQQSAARAKAVIQCFVLGKIVSHISARLHPNVNQLQQATILQWVAARWRFAVKDNGDHGEHPATVAAAENNRRKTRTGGSKLRKPAIRARPQSTMQIHAKGETNRGGTARKKNRF